jgi:hypothetical protein
MRPHAIVAVLFLALGRPATAQIRVDPPGVNVNAQGATTVFLTFGGLRPDQTAVEAFWCGELIPAPAPAIGLQCDPATLFGQLPLRYDRSQTQGAAFSDVMSIPPSVSRRAYQAAVEGQTSAFFYVRRFVSESGGPDEYVAVTCRLSSGGARTPFALTDVEIRFDVDTPILYLRPGETPPGLAAEIAYNGTGRLQGRWEIVAPGEEPPSERDLLTEATLPPEERGAQRRFTQLARFNEYLPPSGRFTLPGPDASTLPTEAEGAYLVLLRIEASNDREAESSRELAGAGDGVVRAGAVAGFPMPMLRYVVARGGGSELAERTGSADVAPLEPVDGAALPPGAAVLFRWTQDDQASYYRLEVVDSLEQPVLAANLPTGILEYRSPPWLAERATAGPVPSGPVRWRVVALDLGGKPIRRTDWRELRFGDLSRADRSRDAVIADDGIE